MTKDEIIELAKEAGFYQDTPMYYDEQMLGKFFRLAYARGMLKQAEQGRHWSDCAVNSEPAYPAGECDCGGFTGGSVVITRQWVGLTDDEIEEIWGEDLRVVYSGNIEATKAIEAKLKEKNT